MKSEMIASNLINELTFDVIEMKMFGKHSDSIIIQIELKRCYMILMQTRNIFRFSVLVHGE